MAGLTDSGNLQSQTNHWQCGNEWKTESIQSPDPETPAPVVGDGSGSQAQVRGSYTSGAERAGEVADSTLAPIGGWPIKPYYEHKGIVIFNSDCRDILPHLPKVDAVVTDPPFFRVKHDGWDHQWSDAPEFLAWIGGICDSLEAILATNGSFFMFASPQMSWFIEGEVRKRFNVLNTIRWQKEAGWHNKTDEGALRSFLQPWEAIIFAEQWGVDQSARTDYSEMEQLLHKEVYSPIGNFIKEQREIAGFARHEVDSRCAPSRKPTGLCYRWEEGACLPTLEQFVEFLRLCGDTRQYEALRSQYEALRRPFNLDDSVPRFDVWSYRTVPPFECKHPCEKPIKMLSDMIQAATRNRAIILDPFMGSGTTLVAAKQLGRRAIGIEIEEKYCDIAVKRLAQEMLPFAEPEPQPEQHTSSGVEL